MDFFISAAQAADAAPVPGQQPSMIPTVVMLVVFGLIFYFLLYRPQAKRAKEHRTMLESLQKGNEVATSGGVLGTVSKITDEYIEVTVAEGVAVKVQKHAVVAVLPKGTLKSI